MDVDIAVLGAGAIGSVLSAHLARAGADVALIARGSRARQIVKQGLAIEGSVKFQTPVAVCEVPAALSNVGTLIVAVKAIDTATALYSLRNTNIGAVLSLQNGVQKNAILQRAFPGSETLGAVANISAELLATGVVQFTGNHGIALGRLDGIQNSLIERLARVISTSGIPTEAVNDIVDREWSKFAGWAGLAGLAIGTRESTARILMDESAARLLVLVIKEMEPLAASHGSRLIDVPPLPVGTIAAQNELESERTIRELGRRFQSTAPTHRVSVLHDLDRRQAIELDETIGFALGIAKQRGLPMPVLRTLYMVASVIARSFAVPKLGPTADS